jgi:hypothetical protein
MRDANKHVKLAISQEVAVWLRRWRISGRILTSLAREATATAVVETLPRDYYIVQSNKKLALYDYVLKSFRKLTMLLVAVLCSVSFCGL